MNSIKPISISLSPNTEKDDILLVLKLIFQPWKWKKGEETQELEEEFKKYLGVKYAFSFNSGRSAFFAILSALKSEDQTSVELKEKDEILLQAFTCNAVANPILWAGLKPVYIDCNEDDFNIDIEDLKRTLRQAQGKKPKVLVVQHTFGLPANVDGILEICRQNNLILIEDCAHSLGAEYKGKLVGTFGKAAFFSFSRDKIISSVYGSIAVTNDPVIAERLQKYQRDFGYPSCYWIFQQLLHPILMNFLILPTYKVFGKYLLVLFQWLHILSKAVHWKEKRGEKPYYFPKRLPNALAILALNQFRKLERFDNHRTEIAEIYFENLKNSSYELPKTFSDRENIFLRFVVKHQKAHQIIKEAWQKNILIGDWYTSPIAPDDTKLEKMKYKTGSCPTAEKLSKIVFNLPTHINVSRDTIKKIITFLKRFEQ